MWEKPIFLALGEMFTDPSFVFYIWKTVRQMYPEFISSDGLSAMAVKRRKINILIMSAPMVFRYWPFD
jgi:hypothetical protein